jgi:hypothetical protein
METPEGREAAEIVESGIGRRDLLRTAAVLGGAATVASIPVGASAAPSTQRSHRDPLKILQPGTGRITGDHYLFAKPDEVLWGYVPALGAQRALARTRHPGRKRRLDPVVAAYLIQFGPPDDALTIPRSSPADESLQPEHRASVYRLGAFVRYGTASKTRQRPVLGEWAN